MSWTNPDYEYRKNLIKYAIEDIEMYLQDMEENAKDWEISDDYIKRVRASFDMFKELF